MTVDVASGLPGATLTNTGVLTTTEFDPNLANNTSTATTTIARSADVQLSLAAAPDPVTAGTNLTYTYFVTNAGPSQATNIAAISDTLPLTVSTRLGERRLRRCDRRRQLPARHVDLGRDRERHDRRHDHAEDRDERLPPPDHRDHLGDRAGPGSRQQHRDGEHHRHPVGRRPAHDCRGAGAGDGREPADLHRHADEQRSVPGDQRHHQRHSAGDYHLPVRRRRLREPQRPGDLQRRDNRRRGHQECQRHGRPDLNHDCRCVALQHGGSDRDRAGSDERQRRHDRDGTITRSADVTLALGWTPVPVNAGNNLTYTLFITNNGPSQATNVTISDTLPVSVTYLSSNAACGNSLGLVTCALASLGAGASTSTLIAHRRRPAWRPGRQSSTPPA